MIGFLKGQTVSSMLSRNATSGSDNHIPNSVKGQGRPIMSLDEAESEIITRTGIRPSNQAPTIVIMQ